MLGVLDPVAPKVGPGALRSGPGALRSDLEALRLDPSCASPLYLAYHSKALRLLEKLKQAWCSSYWVRFSFVLLLFTVSLPVRYRHQRPAI